MPWPKGKPQYPGHMAKMGATRRGPMTEEHKAKIAKALTGKRLSRMHKAAISSALKPK